MNTKCTYKYIYLLILFIFFPVLTHASAVTDTLNMYLTIADSLYDKQCYNKALDYYIKGMKQANKEKDIESYMACTGYIANIYGYFGDKYSGLKFLEKGYKTAVEAGNQNMQSCFLSNLVSMSCKVGDLKNAQMYLDLLKKTPTISEPDGWKYFLLYSEARVYTASHKLKLAMAKHEEALKFARDKDLKVEFVMFQENEIALLYLMMKDYDNALRWGQVCLHKALKENNPELTINAYKVLSDAYKGLDNQAESDKYNLIYTHKKDSLYNIDEFYSLKFELSRYYDDKNAENYNSLKRFSVMTIAGVVVIAVIIIIAILVYKKKKVRSKSKGRSEKTSDVPDTLNIDESQIDIIYERISKVLEDKSNIFNSEFSLNMLCDMVGSNKTYVSWVINNKYNKSFSALLNEKRIAEACIMLDDNEKYKNFTIQSVYEELGYTNASSFIRQFKKIMNVTPIEYRNRNKDK